MCTPRPSGLLVVECRVPAVSIMHAKGHVHAWHRVAEASGAWAHPAAINYYVFTCEAAVTIMQGTMCTHGKE
jgi:hypothetical protein